MWCVNFCQTAQQKSQRLINAIDFCFDVLLFHAKDEKRISEVPTLPRIKIEEIKKLYEGDQTILDFCDFFLLLRKIDKAKFTRKQEYRRHVTMTATLDDGKEVQVTIDIISDYFERTKEFWNYIAGLIRGGNE